MGTRARLVGNAAGSPGRTRTTAALVVAGSSFLLARTVMLISAGMLSIYVPWAAALLAGEFLVDAVAATSALAWLVTGRPRQGRGVLPAVTAMVVMHALRVAVFVLGRTGPWGDCDIRPEHRGHHASQRSSSGVVIAGTGAVLSLMVLAAIWLRRRRR